MKPTKTKSGDHSGTRNTPGKAGCRAAEPVNSLPETIDNLGDAVQSTVALLTMQSVFFTAFQQEDPPEIPACTFAGMVNNNAEAIERLLTTHDNVVDAFNSHVRGARQ